MISKENHGSTPDLVPILAAAAAGDHDAWSQIVSLYGRRLYALAKSRCKDGEVAEEITQSVFATVAQKFGIGQYQEQGKFESWLFRVAMNRIRDHVRRVKRRPGFEDSHSLAETQAVATPTAEQDDPMMRNLRIALTKLSDSDREIVELRHHGGMSFKDMSDLLNEPVGTLLARHHRALKKIKEFIENNPEGAAAAQNVVEGSEEQEGVAGRIPAQGKRKVVS